MLRARFQFSLKSWTITIFKILLTSLMLRNRVRLKATKNPTATTYIVKQQIVGEHVILLLPCYCHAYTHQCLCTLFSPAFQGSNRYASLTQQDVLQLLIFVLSTFANNLNKVDNTTTSRALIYYCSYCKYCSLCILATCKITIWDK